MVNEISVIERAAVLNDGRRLNLARGRTPGVRFREINRLSDIRAKGGGLA